MLKNILTIALILPLCLYAQTKIEWLNSTPGGVQINCFSATDDSTYYAAGKSSIYAKSNDAGKTWLIDSQFKNRIAEFRKMMFFDKNKGVILGDVNPMDVSKIYFTQDAGKSWTESNLPFPAHLNDWIFLDSLKGLAITNGWDEYYRTTDGGRSWTKGTLSFGYQYSRINKNGDGSLTIIGNKSGNDGYGHIPATAYSVILRSTDSGNSWQILKELTGRSILGTYFVDDNTGIICCYAGTVGGSGSNYFYKTKDGGKTLEEKLVLHAEPITDFIFTTKDFGMATLNRAIGYTETQGETWQWKYTDGSLINYFYKGTKSTIYSTGGSIRASYNNGYTWEDITPRFKKFKGDLHIVDDKNIFSNFLLENTNGRSLMKTTDGGITWKNIWDYSTKEFQLVSYPGSSDYFTPQIGIVTTNNSEILRTDDGGNTWNRHVYFTDLYLGKVKIYNEKIALIVASLKKPDNQNGAILYTIDGGRNWNRSNISSAHLLDVDYADKNTWYAVGYDGVFKSTDTGKSWTFNYKIEKSYLSDVSFATKDTGYAVGGSSNIVKTVDGGKNWYPVDFNLGPDIYYGDVKFWGNLGVIVASNDLFITTDRGNSWSHDGVGNTGIAGVSISLFNNTCYVSGYHTTLRFSKEGHFFFGKIIESDPIDNNDTTKSDLISEFTLEQNYPNPFNGDTTLEFTIPNDTYCEMKIYNMLGQIVDAPLKGLKTKGRYKIHYRPSHLSSGVYFYEITSSNYHALKKMVYMK